MKLNYKIIQITDSIIYKEKISELITKKSFKENIIDENNNIDFNFFINIDTKEFQKINQKNSYFFEKINHPHYNKISVYELFCDNQLKGKCVFNNNKDLFVHDSLHYTKKGSEMISKSIIEKIKQIQD